MPQSSGTAPQEALLTGIDALKMAPKSSDQAESARLLKANRERHSQAMEDANRLALLSRKLQQDLERQGSETLPAESMKKADEIIKLARSLKGRMRAF